MYHKVYFSQSDVAQLLGVHRTTIWRRIASGDLPEPRTIAGQKRWHKIDLVRAGMVFLEEQEKYSRNESGGDEGVAAKRAA